MMNHDRNSSLTDNVCIAEGILEAWDPVYGADGSTPPLMCRILSEGERYHVPSWLPLDEYGFPEGQLWPARFTIARGWSDGRIGLTLVRVEADVDVEVLQHLPDGLCDVEGVIQRLGMIANEVRSASLRRSINRMFLRRNISNRFWEEIGPQESGRAYRGGHAEQTVEDAEWIADNTDLSEDQRDVSIVMALMRGLVALALTADSDALA